jgi:hypothetical protein
VVAWGTGTNNSQGEVDYGQVLIPPGLSNVVAVSAGGWHNLALKRDGTITAWGRNDSGQTNVPVGLANVVAIAGGAAHSVALRSNGTVAVWGNNHYGQTNVPAGLTNVVAIAAGGWHTLALRANGSVVAWGANSYPSGIGTNQIISGQTNIPTGLTNVAWIAGGGWHSLAVKGSAPPVFKAPFTNGTWSSNEFSVSLVTRNGRVYALEYKNSLSDSNWTGLPLVAGTGAQLILRDAAANGARRFYRVREW